ncbi:MAG: hypothetical protein NkDv07_0546 [Candidatus Improbicoccus devescovinae]|nr:MAG: hypothetical protein NkDv07_0546 [Candidatus Improbicoccus devescovinae]
MNKNFNLNDQAQEILKIAEKHGVEQNFFFITTFKRYQVQLRVLDELKKVINKNGTLVTKEYVKGRSNLYANPAVQEYNRTTDCANKTVSTLIKIVTMLRSHDSSAEPDPLLEFISVRRSSLD